MPRKKSSEKTATIRVSEKVARMIDVISMVERTTSNEIASPILEPAIKARYKQAVATIQREKEEFDAK